METDFQVIGFWTTNLFLLVLTREISKRFKAFERSKHLNKEGAEI